MSLIRLIIRKNVTLLKQSSNKWTLDKVDNRFYSSQTKDERRSKFNVLKDSDLKLLIEKQSSIVYTHDKYLQTLNSILLLNNTNSLKLKSKLAFKLATIISCLKRLTQACASNYIDEKQKFNLIRNSLINFTDSDFNNEEWEEDDEDECDESVQDKEISHFEFIITKYGTITHRIHLDYSEDILKSVENELELHLAELRNDFKQIDFYVINQLWPIVVTEWLHNYKDSILENKYKTKNEIEIYEDDDPFFIV